VLGDNEPEESMSFKATVRPVDGVSIVDLSGRLTLGEGSGTLRNTVKDLLTKGDKNILLNLKDVSYLDSAGLGEMVGAYASVTNAGGRIALLHTQNKIHDLLQVTKLYTIFSDFSDESLGINELRS
jgi:anti-sigma B factor antagonist